MSIISKQIGWSQESNLLYEILKQLNKLTGLFKPKYKVYTALLTQSGGDAPSEKYAGDEIYIGVTYCIVANDNNYDLTPYGAPNSNVGTCFVCNQTATLPGIWTDIQLNYNSGAPVATVLENTIGNVWFTYNNDGEYSVNSNALFTTNKTFIVVVAGSSGRPDVLVTYKNNTDSNIKLISYRVGLDALENSLLLNTSIEIRVYN